MMSCASLITVYLLGFAIFPEWRGSKEWDMTDVEDEGPEDEEIYVSSSDGEVVDLDSDDEGM